LFGGAQQVVAPDDGVPQRAQAGRLVARAVGQEQQAVGEAGPQCRGGQDARSGGGQLDGEREAVQAPADVGDVRRILLGHGEAGIDRGRALHKERCSLRLGQCRSRDDIIGRRLERRHGEDVLRREPQWDAAGGQDFQAWAGG
jgi:hypothetical protein